MTEAIEYTPLKIKRRENELTIFTDVDRNAKPTKDMTAASGEGNVMVGMFYLDKLPLGLTIHTLRILGCISTVYVRNLSVSPHSSLGEG